ncbi:pirin family protein [Cohnella candidum]|uniref:Pirin family protein n=1 Tax=Cohnella candidum TaxID=2674991 RepID=A0A3G3JXC3_9BACL|nr:pirin-like C-terminal cupin domain-containing protein [Cohnella candidum]AYQ72886.1 pirin family protein [Cohnella candidum]
MFRREIKDQWAVRFNERGSPHVQQAFVLPPDRMLEYDPFLMMAEDWFKWGTFSDHPHRGFQTITYVIDGRLEHVDNAGGRSILGAGDLQYMNAGSGARHAEEAVGDDIVHSLQLWLNLPKALKNTPVAYQDVLSEDVPVVTESGAKVKVYAGETAGVKGPLNSLVPITLTEISLPAGTEYVHSLPANHNAFLYVLTGEIEAGSERTRLPAKTTALLTYEENGKEDEPSVLVMRAVGRSKLLVYSGAPIREPVVAYGPFVMNTMDEVQQAYRDYQAGKFGPPAE